MEESNRLIKNYIENVENNVQNDENNNSDISEFENIENPQCGCLGRAFEMLSYFKWINKYYNLRNDILAANSNNDYKNNSLNLDLANIENTNIEETNVDKTNIENTKIENVTVVEDNEQTSKVKRSFCTINFTF